MSYTLVWHEFLEFEHKWTRRFDTLLVIIIQMWKYVCEIFQTSLFLRQSWQKNSEKLEKIGIIYFFKCIKNRIKTKSIKSKGQKMQKILKKSKNKRDGDNVESKSIRGELWVSPNILFFIYYRFYYWLWNKKIFCFACEFFLFIFIRLFQSNFNSWGSSDISRKKM